MSLWSFYWLFWFLFHCALTVFVREHRWKENKDEVSSGSDFFFGLLWRCLSMCVPPLPPVGGCIQWNTASCDLERKRSMSQKQWKHWGCSGLSLYCPFKWNTGGKSWPHWGQWDWKSIVRTCCCFLLAE